MCRGRVAVVGRCFVDMNVIGNVVVIAHVIVAALVIRERYRGRDRSPVDSK